jgi:hypothetical protein
MPSLFDSIGGMLTGFMDMISPVFRKEYRKSDILRTWESVSAFSNFSSFPARLSRYALYWAFFEGNAYDEVTAQARSFKTATGLYEYIRPVYNPCHRLADLWPTLLMGGTLDPDAGDGITAPSCLPILTDNPALRPAIARLWKDSHWQTKKDMFTRLGPVLGDVAIRINDDPGEGTVTLSIVNPTALKWVDTDLHGRVKGYIIQEPRIDPQNVAQYVDPFIYPPSPQLIVTYTECAFRDGDDVVYRTYRNMEPYAWEGTEAEWRIPYGFVPLVLVPHQKMLPEDAFGWSEFHAGLGKFLEADDLGSKLHDQIRKIVEGAWLFAGVQPPPKKGTPAPVKAQGDHPKHDDPAPGREEMKVFYGSIGATASSLILPVDIQFTSIEIQNLINGFKEDYPELQYDSLRVSGDASAKALREVAKKMKVKVESRRAVYDAHLAHAQKMALAIGGWRGYEGYAGITLADYKSGKLEHRIGPRPVLDVDALDRIEEEKGRADVCSTYALANVPADWVMRNRFGFNDEQMAGLTEAQAKMQADQLKLKAAAKPEPPRPSDSPSSDTPSPA